MRRAVALAGATTLLVTCAPASAAHADDPGATSAQRRSCGKISSTSVYRFARVIAIRNVSCVTARRVAKAYDHRSRTLGGWHCALAHADRPRLFSCGAGGGVGDLRKFPRALEAIGTNKGSGASAARCQTVSYGGSAYILSYRGLTCQSARRKVRRVHRDKRLRGYTCTSGSRFRTGGSCKRGRRFFAWHPAD